MNQPISPEDRDGIVITISQAMLKEKGVLHWTRNFLEAMSKDDWCYYMRQGARPKHDPLYVYLCIGNKIRYRAMFVASMPASMMTFSDGKQFFARAWVVLAGPVEKPPHEIPWKGFRGFCYTKLLW